MGQVLGSNWLSELVVTGATALNMPATYQGVRVRITVGGQQYSPASDVAVNLAVNGFNGLDVGSLAANTLYYIYAVQQSGILGLVASTAAPSTGPSGFLAWKEVGRFRTAYASAVTREFAIANRVGPGDSNQVSKVGPWRSYVPVGLWTTNTVYTGRWRQVGESMELDIAISLTGAPNSATLTANLPSGYVSSNDLPLLSVGVGLVYALDSGVRNYPGVAYINRISGQLVCQSAETTGNASSTMNQLNPFTWGNTDTCTIHASVPIAEFAGLFD